MFKLKRTLKIMSNNFMKILINPFYYMWCLFHGIHWRSSWNLTGIPRFRRLANGGRIYIGEHFCARSTSSGNAIGVFQPVILTVCEPEAEIKIGDNVRISGCSITCSKKILIEDNVMIGSGALIIDTDAHPLHPDDRKKRKPANNAPITIERDVFIGARVIVLKGVRIGSGSVIGAGSVVTKDVPKHSIAAGNPARVVGSVNERCKNEESC